MEKEIAIILPYKEKYTLNEASAAAIWVKDYLEHSQLKNKTVVFGYLTKKNKPLTNNFINLNISNIKYRKNYYYTKSFF